MIQVYLCEDEKIQLEFWEKTISEYMRSANIIGEIVSARQNPWETLKDLERNENTQALFFIDIQMPKYDMDGLNLAKEIRKKSDDHHLVFITAKDDLAYKVFEYQLDILDFIVKKTEYYRENADMHSVMERLNRIFYKISQHQGEILKQKLLVTSGSRRYEIALEDIIYIQAIKGTHLIEINSACKKIQVRQTLKEIFEKINSKNFVFVNKSCFVQKDKILEIDKKNRTMKLKGGYNVEVSVREIKKIYKEVGIKDAISL